MGKKKPDCNTCIYRAVNRIWKCNFETVTGHTRKAVPANRCRHYVEGPAMRSQAFELLEKIRRAENHEKTKRTGPKEKYDWDKAKELYDAKKNDGEIAREMGCHPSVVRQWRGRNGLKANQKAGGAVRPAKYDWDLGRKLHAEGKDDTEIGQALGCSNKIVRNWRGRKGLKANRAPGFSGKVVKQNDSGRDSE